MTTAMAIFLGSLYIGFSVVVAGLVISTAIEKLRG